MIDEFKDEGRLSLQSAQPLRYISLLSSFYKDIKDTAANEHRILYVSKRRESEIKKYNLRSP